MTERFVSARKMTSMSTHALAFVVIGPIITPGIPYDLAEYSVTCNFLDNTYCPLMETEVVQYTLRMYIDWFMAVVRSIILFIIYFLYQWLHRDSGVVLVQKSFKKIQKIIFSE